MGTRLVRTSMAVSVVTALLVSALAVYGIPRLMHPTSATDGLIQPAVYTDNAQPAVATDPQPATTTQPTVRSAPAPATYRQSYTRRASTVRHQRSTRDSVLIVAGSAGTGAAIGAIAGGGKGAGIGAIAGGVGGLVYDRLTAHK